MKEKPFDHIEARIKDAANSSMPAYDEQSWEKMELLLDKEKKRRFPFWWYLFPILLGIGFTGYLLYAPNSKNVLPSSPGQVTSEARSSVGITQSVGTTTLLPGKAAPGKVSPSVMVQSVPASAIKSKTVRTHSTAFFSEPAIVSKHPDLLAENKSKFKSPGKSRMQVKEGIQYVEAINPEEKNALATDSLAIDSSKAAQSEPIVVKTEETLVSTEDTTKLIVNNKLPAKTKSEKKKRSSRFYFLAISGIEMNAVKSLKAPGLSFNYGAGVGFDVSKNVSIQTTFVKSRKKYQAGPGDYRPKAGSYLSMVDIRKVDASCLVYEIPVTVKYYFYNRSGLRLFGAVSLSSYIMKKEDYNYEYIRYNSLYNTSWTYTGNEHFLSVLGLSAGIEKKFKRGISLLAGPNFSIPLKGVGDGKVKLYSASMQVSLKYQPFRSK